MTKPPQFSPRRELGRTGFIATVLGIGDLADRALPFQTCVATARRAIDAGLNVIDTAPGYEAGYSEQIVGEAVKGLRDRLFVIDKIDDREAPVGPQVDASLQRLRLDHTDAFVFHGLDSMETFRKLTEPGAGFDQLADCIKTGKTRFRGISSHNPDVLRAAITAGLCDIVLFPVGPFVDLRYLTDILPLARSRRVGTVCFKTFGAGKLLGDTAGYNRPLQLRPRGPSTMFRAAQSLSRGGKLSSGGLSSDPTAAPSASRGGASDTQPVLPRLSVTDCVHYTLTVDPDVALLGLSYPNEQDLAFAAAQTFHPLSAHHMDDIRRRAVAARKDKGPCWWNPAPDANCP